MADRFGLAGWLELLPEWYDNAEIKPARLGGKVSAATQEQLESFRSVFPHPASVPFSCIFSTA